jgi:ribosomal protein L44E
MRMWLVEPRLMCSQHLLGEHVELHMLVGSLNRGKRIDGFLRDGLVELRSIRRRHAELVVEMQRRGFRHQSPLPEFGRRRAGKVDPVSNLSELARRCTDCRKRIREHTIEMALAVPHGSRTLRLKPLRATTLRTQM